MRHHSPVPDEDQWLRREAEDGYYRAILHVLATDEGGRRSPILSGYRSAWAITSEEDAEHVVHDAPLLIEDAEEIAPGDDGTVRLHPLFWEYWPELPPGATLLMKEGHRTVGTATILERVPPA